MSLFTILIASLLGSPHCAAMCGGFAGIAAHSEKPRSSQVSYHFGRLITYLVLGCLAGFFGAAINQFGSMAGISSIASWITGVIMISVAISMLSGKYLGITRFLPRRLLFIPSRLISLTARFKTFRGVSLGIFSTLLPCGWLYTYVALAAASANSVSGILVMLFFWLGTLPMLLTIGSVSHLLSSSLRKHVPTLVAILMLCAGFFALSGHLTSFKTQGSAHLMCAP